MTEQPTPVLNVRCEKGHPMVERANHDNGSHFLGCTQWPTCTETRPMPEYVKLIREGHTQFPGFGDV